MTTDDDTFAEGCCGNRVRELADSSQVIAGRVRNVRGVLVINLRISLRGDDLHKSEPGP